MTGLYIRLYMLSILCIGWRVYGLDRLSEVLFKSSSDCLSAFNIDLKWDNSNSFCRILSTVLKKGEVAGSMWG